MFFKKLTCLTIIVSITFSSLQIHARELSRDLYLSKNFLDFKSPIDKEMDIIEMLQEMEQSPVTSVTTPPIMVFPPSPTPTVSDHPSLEAQVTELMKFEPKKKVKVPSKAKSNQIEPSSIKPKPLQKSSDAPEIKTILLDDIMSTNVSKPGIRIAFDSSVIIEGKNIQRFMAMDEGFLNLERIDKDHVGIRALKYGGTFVNFWDDAGRRTIYVGVYFPEIEASQSNEEDSNKEEHEKPFRFTYSNDWNTYYIGLKNEEMKRQSYSFLQNFALSGQTPYGFLDSALVTDEFNGKPSISYRTVGLSRIPVPETSNLNFRVLDIGEYLSPLTLPSTRLDGFSSEVDIDRLFLRAAYAYGEQKPYFTSLSPSSASTPSTFIHAYKLTVNPADIDNQMSFNLAKSSGYREEYVSNKVFSYQARKKILNTYLNGEYANDTRYTSSLAGMKWKEGPFGSALNFRQINKNFTHISGYPSNQGETGAVWSTNYDTKKVSTQTDLNIYRQYLYYNSNNPHAFNYDASASVYVPLAQSVSSDTNFYYVHTPGESSPRRNVSVNQRITRMFNFFNFKNMSTYIGGGLQRTRYEFSPESEYDRWSVSTGFQLPLTNRLSLYANYEDSWVYELESEDDLNPHVFSTGFNYNRELMRHLFGSFSLFYRKEMGVAGTSSYLSGEDSAGVSAGLTYSPTADASFFFDTRSRKVWPHLAGNFTNYDLDIRFGCRLSFDVFKKGWDPHGRISGFVYRDKDGKGLYDKGDIGLPGIRVKAGKQEAMTNKAGFYKMGVSAKRISVTPVPESLPPNVVFSTPIVRTVDINPWGSSRADFGLNSQTGVYGLIFVDKNNNGTPDPEDQFVPNAKILLDKKYTSTSDSQGAFYFRNIAEGEHSIKIDINSLPMALIPQIKLDSQIKVAEGTTYLFHIPLKSKDK